MSPISAPDLVRYWRRCLVSVPGAHGTAIEQSATAASLAAENFEQLGLADRISLLHGSWAGWTDWGTCDLIISNPPYICSQTIPELAPEVRDFDPLDALDGGADGLDAYREIITLAAQHMKSGGAPGLRDWV